MRTVLDALIVLPILGLGVWAHWKKTQLAEQIRHYDDEEMT